jgi:hypothetical protein
MVPYPLANKDTTAIPNNQLPCSYPAPRIAGWHVVEDTGRYFEWLRSRPAEINQIVSESLKITQERDAKAYSKHHAGIDHFDFQIGDAVLLLDKCIKPGSNKVLSQRPYEHKFLVTDMVKGDPNIGTAFRLTNAKTGKTYQVIRLRPIEKISIFTAGYFNTKITTLESSRQWRAHGERLHWPRVRGK